MNTLLLFLGGSFLVIGVQFFRGKWLWLMDGNLLGDDQGEINSAGAIKAGKWTSPGVIICGVSLICLVFDGYWFWEILGISLLIISGLYFVFLVVIAYIYWAKS